LTPILLLAFHAASSPGAAAPRGLYVEARTASVFAGACHYGAEATTAGREAVLAWHGESGGWDGVDLAGIDAAAAIAGEANLSDAGAARRSILYLSDRASPAQRRAAEAWIRADLAGILGEVGAVEVVPLSVRVQGEDYRVDAGALFQIEGRLLPDRACCKMPLSVWYRPFAPVSHPIVGCNATFRFADSHLGPVWTRC